jgi:hypothetical protein
MAILHSEEALAVAVFALYVKRCYSPAVRHSDNRWRVAQSSASVSIFT